MCLQSNMAHRNMNVNMDNSSHPTENCRKCDPDDDDDDDDNDGDDDNDDGDSGGNVDDDDDVAMMQERLFQFFPGDQTISQHDDTTFLFY